MTPKEKAEEFITKFMEVNNIVYKIVKRKVLINIAKRNALKAVDEIIASLDYDYIGFERQNKYYKQVKQEIELL